MYARECVCERFETISTSSARSLHLPLLFLWLAERIAFNCTGVAFRNRQDGEHRMPQALNCTGIHLYCGTHCLAPTGHLQLYWLAPNATEGTRQLRNLSSPVLTLFSSSFFATTQLFWLATEGTNLIARNKHELARSRLRKGSQAPTIQKEMRRHLDMNRYRNFRNRT